jgi:hypothetical protein
LAKKQGELQQQQRQQPAETLAGAGAAEEKVIHSGLAAEFGLDQFRVHAQIAFYLTLLPVLLNFRTLPDVPKPTNKARIYSGEGIG